jgi:hypothetical protein
MENRMSNLSVIDGIGFGAAGLVLATFCMGSMNTLRWVAIASNVAFIAYGYLGNLAPVLLLHALLLPVNIYRLAQLRGTHLPTDPAEAQREAGRSEQRTSLGLLRGVEPKARCRRPRPDGAGII